MRKLVVLVFAALLMVQWAPVSSTAQTETGQIVGTVTDPTGAVVPKATVVIRNVGTGAERTTETDDRGNFVVTNLLPAVYQVTVEKQGFAKTERRVQVTVGSKVALDVPLAVGAAVQVVEVAAEAGVMVNTQSQAIEQMIDSKKLIQLPTFNRDPYSLVLIAPNVSTADPTGRGAGVAINGLRAASTNILLDGTANNDEFVAAVGQTIPLDAVQEFSVITNNFSAEYGRAAAGIVNVATKSGTNELHGSAFWFGRYSALSSNTFQNNANNRKKPVFTRNQFGYTVGGPVMKDKLFFFQSTEWTRIRSSATRFVVIPTAQLIAAADPETRNFFSTFGQRRSGLQTLGTLTRQNLIDGGAGDPCPPPAPPPAPNACRTRISPGFPVFDRVAYSRPADSGGGDPQNTYSLVGRGDWNISPRTQVYGRYAVENRKLLKGANADSPYAGYDTGATFLNNSFAISLVRSWSPKFTTQSKLVFNRLNQQQPLAEKPSSPTLFFRLVRASFLGDFAALPGYLPFSPGSGIPFGGPQNFVQAYEDVNSTRGSHQFRFGGSYVYIRDNRTFGAYQNPSAALSTSTIAAAFENFLLGQLARFDTAVDPQGKFPCRNPAAPDPTCLVSLPVRQPSFSRSNRYHEFALYLQDTWKATRRLTLNLGVRWEYFGVQHNKNANLDSNYYDGSGGSIFERVRNGHAATVPNSPIGGLWRKDWNNFAPRVGFAWDIFGNGKTSLRGGYGISYERNFGNVTFNVIQNPPNYAVLAVLAPVDFPRIPIPTDVFGPLGGATGSRPLPRVSLRNVDSNIGTAYAHFWSLSAERQVLPKVFVALDYSGSKGEKLYSLENPNRVGAGHVYLGDPCPTPGNPFVCTARLRTTQFTFLNRRGQKAFSVHNAANLRVNLVNPYNTGLTLSANYTWAHTFDNLSSTFSESANNFNLGLLDPFNPQLDRGSADFDLRHRMVISAIWNIPFAKNTTGAFKRVLDGWTVAPIITARTGSPFSVFDCTNARFEVCPRMFAVGTVTREGPSNPPAGSTRGFFNYITFLPGQFDTSYVHPVTGSSEFGPYPRNMTPRNFFRGPKAWNIDLGIYKDTRITERYALQFRTEMFNALNHPTDAIVGGETDIDATPIVRTRRDGRRNIQFTMKLIF